jgi:two-component system, chemotaxis family, chemotaxis protein CheY
METRKKTVLICDDESHIRIFLKNIFQSMNTEIIGEAKHGMEAVAMFKETNPDITMLDINLPGKTGDEALREIMAVNPDAFVIMMTSISDTETVEKCIDLGAANYIRKDTPIHELKKIIRQSLKEFEEASNG